MTYTISYPENVSVEEQRRAYAIEHTGAYFAMSAVELEKFLKGPEVAEATEASEIFEQERASNYMHGWNDAIDAALEKLEARGFVKRSNITGVNNAVNALHK